MAWCIERAKNGSTCHVCQVWIPRDQYRFGNWDLDRWYHLDCAVERNPRSFEPFAEQVAKLLAAPSPPDEPAQYPRNPELEARLVASPDDDAERAVYADWLQSAGDPWGELIALELAGKDARSCLRDNLDALIGALPPRMFEWRRGFVHKVSFPARMRLNDSHELLLEVLALRTAMLVRELYFPSEPNEFSVELINGARTLTSMFAWYARAIGYELALPNLEELTIQIRTPYVLDPKLSLFDVTRLPKLARVNVESDLAGIPLDNLERALRGQRFELRML